MGYVTAKHTPRLLSLAHLTIAGGAHRPPDDAPPLADELDGGYGDAFHGGSERHQLAVAGEPWQCCAWQWQSEILALDE